MTRSKSRLPWQAESKQIHCNCSSRSDWLGLGCETTALKPEFCRTADTSLPFTFIRSGLKSQLYVFLWLNLYLVPSYWHHYGLQSFIYFTVWNIKKYIHFSATRKQRKAYQKISLLKLITLLLCSKCSLLHFFNPQKGKLQFAARGSAITAGHAVLKYHSNVNSSLTQLVQFYHWASV